MADEVRKFESIVDNILASLNQSKARYGPPKVVHRLVARHGLVVHIEYIRRDLFEHLDRCEAVYLVAHDEVRLLCSVQRVGGDPDEHIFQLVRIEKDGIVLLKKGLRDREEKLLFEEGIVFNEFLPRDE